MNVLQKISLRYFAGNSPSDSGFFTFPNFGDTHVFDIRSQKYMCRSCRTEYGIKAVAVSVRESDFMEYLTKENASLSIQGYRASHAKTAARK